MLTGFEQVGSVVVAIAGDMSAADHIHLVLPETGVCSTTIDAADAAAGCWVAQRRPSRCLLLLDAGNEGSNRPEPQVRYLGQDTRTSSRSGVMQAERQRGQSRIEWLSILTEGCSPATTAHRVYQ